MKKEYRIFVKRYGYFSSPKNYSKNIGKNISKNLSNKYSQKLNGLLQMHLKLPQKESFKER